MKGVRKTFFDPLANSKARIRKTLESLPIGSAHPYRPDSILLYKTARGVEEIDISSYEEAFFYNAVDLGEMGEVLLQRMSDFGAQLSSFKEYDIVQAPAATFEVPIHRGKMAILAVSKRYPTYWDLCLADSEHNTCCYSAAGTFKGISHSGDINKGQDLLQFLKLENKSLSQKEYCVFISGFQSTRITKFLGTHPALLVADHEEKLLYVIPVPLDEATIGDATICCPLVIRRRRGALVCSILPKAATDQPMSCDSWRCNSESFKEAIASADFTIQEPEPGHLATLELEPSTAEADKHTTTLKYLDTVKAKPRAVFLTPSATCPSLLKPDGAQLIRFGTGLEFVFSEDASSDTQSTAVVLPCVFGGRLEGPILLATGTGPVNVPFLHEKDLRTYYDNLEDVVFIVDEAMTDNARNLATPWRMNALFIVQAGAEKKAKTAREIEELLNAININAVTALAGPQSLVLVQVRDRYYFYSGLANTGLLDTSTLSFGDEVSSAVTSSGMRGMLDPRIARLVNLDDSNSILMQSSGQWVKPQDLPAILQGLSIDQVAEMRQDILAAVPQLQKILNQKGVRELAEPLIQTLSAIVNGVAAPFRDAYVQFVSKEYNMADPASVDKKNRLLGDLRKATKSAQNAVASTISSLGAMVSTQTTSKRTHDLKRLARQTNISKNVEAASAMTFEAVAECLETYAVNMGVMLLNINPGQYENLLNNLKRDRIDASKSCSLDSRLLYLNGLDAGIMMEVSQQSHDGPLKRQFGSTKPIMALPRLTQGSSGSMIAWVCWDEFVDLKNPFSVRWIDKCNETHIAALRIIMRSTLSQAVASRHLQLQPSSPETGQLMSALLMAAMGKLAAMRTTAPVEVAEAEDTVTKLMRGLFGNFLTLAGSGVRPLSMVWQLFGQDANFDLPANDVEWDWYSTAVKLYPYTGWPLAGFLGNLERLLDKVILRVVTKNEKTAEIKKSRMSEMIKYCKIRNIQLEHSRTIITIFMRMLTTEGVDTAAVATRLLAQVPHTLEKQTVSYTWMMDYLKHLAGGGKQRESDNVIAAIVYVRRSAAFSKVKTKVSEAWGRGQWDKVQKYCQVMVDTHAKIAKFWHISPTSFKIQNMDVYKELADADLKSMSKSQCKAWTNLVMGDAEKPRVPWQVGKKGEFGDEMEPLDEAFIHEIMTGGSSTLATAAQTDAQTDAEAEAEHEVTEATKATKVTEVAEIKTKPVVARFSLFEDTVKGDFLIQMSQALSVQEVCRMLSIPVSTMRVFAEALHPGFVWDDLGGNFKAVILDLLVNRAGRIDSQPARKLLGLDKKHPLQIEGA